MATKKKRSKTTPEQVTHVVTLKSGDTIEALHVTATRYAVETPWGHVVEIDAASVDTIDEYEIDHENEATSSAST